MILFSCGKTASQHSSTPGQVELSAGRPPDPTWKRPPGRPRAKWTDQLLRDNNNVPIATLWRQPLVAVTRERRYGPSRLRADDDDDDDDYYYSISCRPVTVFGTAASDRHRQTQTHRHIPIASTALQRSIARVKTKTY